MCEDVIYTHIPYSLLRPNEILFSSLYIISTVMLNFCIKSVHSFLAFTTKDNNSGTLVLDQQQLHSPLRGCPNIPSPVSGLSFITFSDNTHNPTNVVDSAAIKPPPPPAAATTIAKKDPGGIGFLDDVGGRVSGLMSCTESLGFESSDERRVDDQVMERIISEERGLRAGTQRKWRRRRREEEVRKFPPPLSSLNRDGRRCFFLRPVRRDGRLELTGVKIDRMEVLHASRQDGRLRLDMVRDVVDLEEDIEEEETVGNGIDNNNIIEEEEEEEKLKVGNIDDIEEEMDEEKIGHNIIEEEVEEEGKIIEDILKEEEEEGASGKWVFGAVVSGGGDGFRRCHEVASHHHHHHNLHHYLHAWGQHCLTIR